MTNLDLILTGALLVGVVWLAGYAGEEWRKQRRQRTCQTPPIGPWWVRFAKRTQWLWDGPATILVLVLGPLAAIGMIAIAFDTIVHGFAVLFSTPLWILLGVRPSRLRIRVPSRRP